MGCEGERDAVARVERDVRGVAQVRRRGRENEGVQKAREDLLLGSTAQVRVVRTYMHRQ
jgi:hypothetical protein